MTHKKKIEIWFQDEARVGQQGTITRVWAKRGTRPRPKRDTRYQWSYMGDGGATSFPAVNWPSLFTSCAAMRLDAVG